MLYAVLIYSAEGVFDRLPQDVQEGHLAMHRAVQEEYSATGALGAVARLMNSSTAVTVRESAGAVLVTDGPFAETKEQLGGLYLLECETMDEAIDAVKKLPMDITTYEIRPIGWANDKAISPRSLDDVTDA